MFFARFHQNCGIHAGCAVWIGLFYYSAETRCEHLGAGCWTVVNKRVLKAPDTKHYSDASTVEPKIHTHTSWICLTWCILTFSASDGSADLSLLMSVLCFRLLRPHSGPSAQLLCNYANGDWHRWNISAGSDEPVARCLWSPKHVSPAACSPCPSLYPCQSAITILWLS